MGKNELINKQSKDLKTIDHHVLPDTLNADEWQTFILSGFLNEYAIIEVKSNIEKLKNRIKELEDKKSSKYSFFDLVIIFLYTIPKLLLWIIGIMVSIILIGLVIGLLSAIFKNSAFIHALDSIFVFIFNVFLIYPSFLLRKIFNIFPGWMSLKDISFELFPIAILSAVQIAIVLSLITVIGIFATNKDIEISEEKRLKDLERAKKELEDYLPIAEDITNECNKNLSEIYGQNLIPTTYHDYESLGMLYGYFACKAANTFQDAAKEYLQDKRTNRLVSTMEKTNELLKIIAQNTTLDKLNFDENDKYIDKLIEDNDKSVINRIIKSNPINLIYSKANDVILRARDKSINK